MRGNKTAAKRLRSGQSVDHSDSIYYPRARNISNKLTKLASATVLLLFSNVVAGCSNSEADAAQFAAQAEILLDQKRFAEARQTIAKSIAARDDVAEYHLLRGRIEYLGGSFENAFSAYSEALALSPSNEEALQAVSQIGLRVGRFNESVDATEKLLVLNPNQTDALLMRGLHALIKRNYADAAKTADQIISIDRGNEGGVVLKARASFLAGNPQEAAQILDSFESSRPNTQAVSLTRLEIYRALRNPQMMAKQYAELSKLRPDDLVLRLDHANFLYKTNGKGQATKLVSSVLADKSATPQNITNALNLWEEYAVRLIAPDISRAIASSGTSTSRIAAARYFTDVGNLAAPIVLLAGMKGSDADAERAKIAFLRGNNARAQSLVSQILDSDETHCSALKTRSNLLHARGKFADALGFAQRASSECPDQPRLWHWTANVYDAMDDEFNARRVFGQGLESNKQSQALTRAYSEYLLVHGSGREAIAVARKLTRAAPALTSGWRLYTEICTKTQSSCITEARQGLVDTQTRFGVDLLPGELPPNGLFGRLVAR